MVTAEYLADLAWQWYKGETDRVKKMLLAQGKTVEERDGYWIVSWPDFTTGIELDIPPQDAVIQLLLALIGPYWPMVTSEAMTKAQQIMSRRLAEERKAAKAKAPSPSLFDASPSDVEGEE